MLGQERVERRTQSTCLFDFFQLRCVRQVRGGKGHHNCVFIGNDMPMIYPFSAFWKQYKLGESSAIIRVSVLKRNAPTVSGAEPTFMFGAQDGLGLLQQNELKAAANEIYADVENTQPHLFLHESDEKGISGKVTDSRGRR